MALVDHDSWEIEYEGCGRMVHQLLVHLHKRQQIGTSSTPAYIKLTSDIQSGLQKLRKDVAHLKVLLDNDITWEACSPEELERRRSLLHKLTLQLQEVSDKFTSSSSADRSAYAASSVWQDAGNAPTIVDIPTDMETLIQRKAEMLEQQNRGLEVLSATISRQRELATVLGNEVEDQNNILDNLANTIDRVDADVHQETRNIGLVSRRDSTWGYWLVIILLFVAILLVVLL